MKSLLNIGNEKEVIGAVADSVIKILQTGRETHTEQETIRAALDVMAKLSTVSNIAVTNSTFTGDLKADSSHIKVDDDSDEYDEDERHYRTEEDSDSF